MKKIKIAIATGSEDLNNAIVEFSNQQNKELQFEQIFYKEYLLENTNYDICCISKILPGEIDFEQLIFKIKSLNKRIIYILVDENDTQELELCIKYQIQDVLLQPITPKNIIDVIQNPKTFKDIEFIYKKLGLEINLDINKNQPNKKSIIKEIKKVEVKQNIIAGITNICVVGLFNGAGATFISKCLKCALSQYALTSLIENIVNDESNMIKILYNSKTPLNIIDSSNNKTIDILNMFELFNYIIIVIDPYIQRVVECIDYLKKIKKVAEEKQIKLIYIINKYNDGVDKIEILNLLDIYPDIYINYINPKYIYRAAHEQLIEYDIKEVKKELQKPFEKLIEKLLPQNIYKKKSIFSKRSSYKK